MKLKVRKRPRNLALHLLLMVKSKRGGVHTPRSEKRQQNRRIKELREEGA